MRFIFALLILCIAQISFAQISEPKIKIKKPKVKVEKPKVKVEAPKIKQPKVVGDAKALKDMLQDTLEVDVPKSEFQRPIYNKSYTRHHDLIHTKLDVRFDWTRQYLLGVATLTLQPHFYEKDFLVLDAKGFQINSVEMVSSGNQRLRYDYKDKKKLRIYLDREYKSGEPYTVRINYYAKPNELIIKGSAAIAADKGLYFINPDNTEDKPQQIWTQGETESSSCWFPTIDSPNERCTQEISITVKDKFTTLSNGLLISSNKNSDGTRTDTWKQERPHAPYLFMMTVGEFAKVTDRWREAMEVSYYVEPEYEENARNIFANTIEMLNFFSESLNYPYPWEKYSQIIVRDYVSGAMENTTAVIYGDFVQKTDRELIDNDNDGIVAHEMAHHWFGDLVTCESWSNLALNESFANYSEYLWFENKYGRDRADYHLLNEMRGYMRQVQRTGAHDLVYYDYKDKEDTFDAHSYNKGGMILHMLRYYVGDLAFWASLNKYLTDNEYSAVEADELRMAFEDITGEDLNWFFDQWFFDKGHPSVTISTEYNTTYKALLVTVEQTQDPELYRPIFQFPLSIDVYTATGKPKRHTVFVDDRIEVFKIPRVLIKPFLVNVDPEKVMLWEKTQSKTEDELAFQFKFAPRFLDRYEAVKGLKDVESIPAQLVKKQALKDPFYAVRVGAIDVAGFGDIQPSKDMVETVATMASSDENSKVRAKAVEAIGFLKDSEHIPLFKKIITDEKETFPVISSALRSLMNVSPTEALNVANELDGTDNPRIIATLSDIYKRTKDPSNLSFFENNMHKMSGFSLVKYFENYADLLSHANETTIARTVGNSRDMAMDMKQSTFHRYGSATLINNMRRHYINESEKASTEADKMRFRQKADEFSRFIDDIKRVEKSDRLKAFYSGWQQ